MTRRAFPRTYPSVDIGIEVDERVVLLVIVENLGAHRVGRWILKSDPALSLDD